MADRLCVVNESPIDESVSRYIHSEYIDFVTDKISLSAIGYIRGANDVVSSTPLRELVKDWLYEDENSLYVKYGDKYLRIIAGEECFEIIYQFDFENNVAFYVLETLIRIYSHKVNIEFFHASSFVYGNKVYMLNGFGGSGKTEIMIDYLLKGASFISDDIVIVNEEGKIFPYRVSIPINWGCITDDFVRQLNVPHYIFKIASYCKSKNGRITKRVYGKLAQKYFLGYYPHTRFTRANTKLKFHTVDHCFWLQDANFDGPFNLTNQEFFNYMDLCLKNESRKYFDFDGFMALKFPFLKSFYIKIEELRRTISSRLSVEGLAVKHRNFKETSKKLSSI